MPEKQNPQNDRPITQNLKNIIKYHDNGLLSKSRYDKRVWLLASKRRQPKQAQEPELQRGQQSNADTVKYGKNVLNA